MSTLAHEGNPKEDDITVGAASVLSTAQLDLDFPFFGGVPNVPSSDVAVQGISSSCSDVFEWIGENDNQTFNGSAGGRDWLYLSNSPCLSSGGSLDRLADTNLDLRVNSTPTCYGILWKEYQPAHFPAVQPACGASIDWRVMFNGVVDGTGRAGICVWVDDDSSHESAYCYALIIDIENQITGLYKFSNESLARLNTPLATISAVPSIGQIIELVVIQYPSDVGLNSNGAFGSIWNSSYSSQLFTADYVVEESKPFDGSTTRHSRCGFGFISVGGTTAGKLSFKHSPDTSCQNSLTPFLIVDSSGGS